ncbi:hypothetical protein ACFL4O_02095 [bacterium]
MHYLKNRRISVIVLTLYIGLVCRNLSYTINTPLLSAGLSKHIGYIVDTFQGSGSSPQKLFIIEDLHCNKEAQNNITRILEFINKKHGNIDIIGLEGASKEISLNILQKIKKKETKTKVINELLGKGYLTGAQVYALKNKGIKLYGVEDETLYRKNFNKLYEGIGYRQEINDIIARLEKDIEFAKHVLSENNAGIKVLEQKKLQYEEHKIPLEKYLKYLKNVIEAHLINTDKYKQFMRTKSSFNEFWSSFETISKFEKLSSLKHHDYLTKKQDIDLIKLFDEKDIIEKKAFELLAKYKDMRKLLFLKRYARLLKKYLNNELNINRVQEFEQGRERFWAIVNDLGARISRINHLEENKELIDKAYKCMKEFYRLADKRNEVMVRNMLNKLQKSNSSLVISNYKYPSGILVIGGYHTQRVTQILRNKGISYQVIRPNITQAHDKQIYMDRIKDKAQLLSGAYMSSADTPLNTVDKEESAMALIFNGTDLCFIENASDILALTEFINQPERQDKKVKLSANDMRQKYPEQAAVIELLNLIDVMFVYEGIDRHDKRFLQQKTKSHKKSLSIHQRSSKIYNYDKWLVREKVAALTSLVKCLKRYIKNTEVITQWWNDDAHRETILKKSTAPLDFENIVHRMLNQEYGAELILAVLNMKKKPDNKLYVNMGRLVTNIVTSTSKEEMLDFVAHLYFKTENKHVRKCLKKVFSALEIDKGIVKEFEEYAGLIKQRYAFKNSSLIEELNLHKIYSLIFLQNYLPDHVFEELLVQMFQYAEQERRGFTTQEIFKNPDLNLWKWFVFKIQEPLGKILEDKEYSLAEVKYTARAFQQNCKGVFVMPPAESKDENYMLEKSMYKYLLEHVTANFTNIEKAKDRFKNENKADKIYTTGDAVSTALRYYANEGLNMRHNISRLLQNLTAIKEGSINALNCSDKLALIYLTNTSDIGAVRNMIETQEIRKMTKDVYDILRDLLVSENKDIQKILISNPFITQYIFYKLFQAEKLEDIFKVYYENKNIELLKAILSIENRFVRSEIAKSFINAVGKNKNEADNIIDFIIRDKRLFVLIKSAVTELALIIDEKPLGKKFEYTLDFIEDKYGVRLLTFKGLKTAYKDYTALNHLMESHLKEDIRDEQEALVLLKNFLENSPADNVESDSHKLIRFIMERAINKGYVRVLKYLLESADKRYRKPIEEDTGKELDMYLIDILRKDVPDYPVLEMVRLLKRYGFFNKSKTDLFYELSGLKRYNKNNMLILEMLKEFDMQEILNLKAINDNTLLQLFVREKNELMSKFIISQDNKNVYAVNTSNQTPLLRAVLDEYPVEFIELLLRYGSEMDKLKTESFYSKGPILWRACKALNGYLQDSGHENRRSAELYKQIIKLFIAKGADINNKPDIVPSGSSISHKGRDVFEVDKPTKKYTKFVNGIKRNLGEVMKLKKKPTEIFGDIKFRKMQAVLKIIKEQAKKQKIDKIRYQDFNIANILVRQGKSKILKNKTKELIFSKRAIELLEIARKLIGQEFIEQYIAYKIKIEIKKYNKEEIYIEEKYEIFEKQILPNLGMLKDPQLITEQERESIDKYRAKLFLIQAYLDNLQRKFTAVGIKADINKIQELEEYMSLKRLFNGENPVVTEYIVHKENNELQEEFKKKTIRYKLKYEKKDDKGKTKDQGKKYSKYKKYGFMDKYDDKLENCSLEKNYFEKRIVYPRGLVKTQRMKYAGENKYVIVEEEITAQPVIENRVMQDMISSVMHDLQELKKVAIGQISFVKVNKIFKTVKEIYAKLGLAGASRINIQRLNLVKKLTLAI